MKTRSTFFPARRWALAFSLALAGDVHAADIFWGGTSGSWATLSNWSTDPDNATPNPIAVPAGGDELFFNISSVNANTVIDLTANRNTEKLIFSNTGTTGFRGNTSGTTARTLTIQSGGILINPGAGAVTFGVTSGTTGAVHLSFPSSQSITNNGSSNLNINHNVAGAGSPTLTNDGTGTNYIGTGALQSSVGKIVQNSATSTLGLRANSSGFTGTVEILKGTVAIGTSGNNFGTSAGQVLFGASFGSDAATIDINDNSSQTYTAKPIVLGATTGTLTIRIRDDSGANTHTITGAISGNNNLTLESQGGDDKLNFNTGGLNNTGTITHIGTGAGDLTINSVIGSNVTGVTQNSATSRLVLNGTNTYTGDTTVSAGTLVVDGDAIPNTGKLVLTGGKVNPSGTEIVATLFFGAVQQAAGTWGSTASAAANKNDTYFTGTGVVSVSNGPNNYTAWATTNGAGQNIQDDHDNDGVANGIEYFLAGPNGNSTGFTVLPGITNTSGTLSITWTKAATYPGTYGTHFWIETTDNLTGAWTVETIGINVTASGNNITYTFPAGTRRFARLVVTGP